MSFPTTHWTMIASATLHGDAAGRQALARLCHDYRPAILEFLRTQGYAGVDLEDSVQNFFLKLLESRLWKKAVPEKGRFRSFIIGVLQHTMLSEHAKQCALKRGGASITESLQALETAGVELAAPDDAAVVEAFDRAWAEQLLANALLDVEQEYRSPEKQRQFQLLKAHLTGTATLDYAAGANLLSVSVAAYKSLVFRLRQRFRDCLHARIAATVGSAAEIDAEMQYLHRLLASPAPSSPDE